MIFGFLLLVVVSILTGRVALGKVEESTSYGLPQMITMLAMLVGGFSTWAFSAPSRSADKTEEKPEKDKDEPTDKLR